MKRIVVLVLTVAMLTASASAIHPLALQSLQADEPDSTGLADKQQKDEGAAFLLLGGALAIAGAWKSATAYEEKVTCTGSLLNLSCKKEHEWNRGEQMLWLGVAAGGMALFMAGWKRLNPPGQEKSSGWPADSLEDDDLPLGAGE